MRPFATLVTDDTGIASQAVAAEPGARFVAGGTTLVDLMKLDVETPSRLVDITRLPLADIEDLPDGGVRIGALVRNSDAARHPLIVDRYPVLAEALRSGASAQLRNMATVGGNLLQRTRCGYFRDAAARCNKREPGAGCDALAGVHKRHAILGTSDSCFAVHPGDMPVALVALDAVVRTRLPDGSERAVPIDELHIPYGEDPAREHVLEPGELITHVDLPPTPWFARSAYVKVRDRASYEFALASAAVAMDLVGNEGRAHEVNGSTGAPLVRDVRIALGGVATKPWRARAAEDVLRGGPASRDAVRAAVRAELAGAEARSGLDYKLELTERTLLQAVQRAAAIDMSPGAGECR